MLRNAAIFSLSVLFFCFVSGSCKKQLLVEDTVSSDTAYFSIKQFIADQIETNYGNPYTLYRIVAVDGKLDSTLQSIDDIDWTSVFGTFTATDISARKFLGKYNFAVSDDNTTGDRGFIYTAKEPELFTRLLQINVDPSNYRITSIYLETAKEDFWERKTQKLLYVPLHVIQIQETEDGFLTSPKEVRVEYRFPFDESTIF